VYFENGKVSTTFSYTDGLLNGPVVINDDKGVKIVEGNYKNGKEDGKWIFYDESGKVKKTEEYELGKKK
jgi:morn repeat-containing protein (fragment)